MATKNSDYSVIYADDDFVVLNKRSGILIAADRYNEDAPRLDLLAEKEFGKLYAVHRIDKDTSGLIIYARNISKNTTIVIPAHNVPAFKPAKTFIAKVSK